MSVTVGESTLCLVRAAAGGDERAWAALIDRYGPLVMAVIRRFTISRADAADVNQTVWLRLVEHLDRIREPEALPGWIVQTTRNECLRVLRAGHRTWLFDPLDGAAETLVSTAAPEPGELDERLLAEERRQALRDAYAELPPRCRELVGLLLVDPPLSYEQIGERLGVPIGSIGPTRGRCVHRLRTCPALVAFIGAAGQSDSHVRKEARRDAAAVG
ncbi:RNA polymerase sigma factor [Amorphoplanes digitatis]|uniref:RNA polymerase sigma factor (Sigma-70 family) n=1 Tax=Actinoplanes digitatis TaxID=1868 RepID=A0A7W7HZY8_9ACTN|nr:sigma-70 family RNA polymerase sigma factor [Actinoplanes digitatis]MBB4763818.1 RNA polymerase sigma factor (sigma-70 family) [Actinoplanes digitatis]BFE73059.1 sigma-70 family RNA polymerase sigma factor [Actinoplanes digitatis]GID95702.1 RNA polymerase sigma factor [Actinoplanes digitatis]